jgi:hypothetical protein
MLDPEPAAYDIPHILPLPSPHLGGEKWGGGVFCPVPDNILSLVGATRLSNQAIVEVFDASFRIRMGLVPRS